MLSKNSVGPQRILEQVNNIEKADSRVGKYYLYLTYNQKQRFKRIVKSLAHHYNLMQNRNPLEMIVLRQIALSLIRIEEAQAHIQLHPEIQWVSDIEKWLLLAQKELREAIGLMANLCKVGGKRDGKMVLDQLRDNLRDEKGLPKSTTELQPDGHDRRYHDDGITRTS